VVRGWKTAATAAGLMVISSGGFAATVSYSCEATLDPARNGKTSQAMIFIVDGTQVTVTGLSTFTSKFYVASEQADLVEWMVTDNKQDLACTFRKSTTMAACLGPKGKVAVAFDCKRR
jgi:hypothetical protein